MAGLKTQGSDLYFIDPATDTAVLVDCITSLEGLTAPREQIETTCLADSARTFVAGLENSGTASFGINFDPSSASHLRLLELKQAGTVIDWALGLSDGVAVPTVDTAGDFVYPTTRSYITFSGYVSDVPFNLALNAVVQSTVAIQTSGPILLVRKTTP